MYERSHGDACVLATDGLCSKHEEEQSQEHAGTEAERDLHRGHATQFLYRTSTRSRFWFKSAWRAALQFVSQENNNSALSGNIKITICGRAMLKGRF